MYSLNKAIPVGIGVAAIVIIAMAAGFIGYEVEPTPSATSLDEPFSISSSELEQQMTLDPNLVVIDMRDSNLYVDGHIAGSSVDVMEGATLDKRIKTMFGRIPEVTQNIHVVLVGDSQNSASDSAQIMNDAGIKASFLADGIESWNEDLSTKMTSTVVSSEELYEQLQNQDDVYLLDVREPSELEVTMISGSKNIPLADIFIEENLSEIPTDKPVVVILWFWQSCNHCNI